MAIRSLHKSLWGQSIDVGGTIVKVGHDGVADVDGVIESHLLQQRHNWDKVLQKAPPMTTPEVIIDKHPKRGSKAASAEDVT